WQRPTPRGHFTCSPSPKYARSTDGGRTFGPAKPVVVGGKQRTAGLEYSAWDMAVGQVGRIHVAMSTNAWKLKLPQEEWASFYAPRPRRDRLLAGAKHRPSALPAPPGRSRSTPQTSTG